MRVFVLLRSVFFVVLLTAITIFLAHSQLCINYTPHNLQGIITDCEESMQLISGVNLMDGGGPNRINLTNETAIQFIESLDARVRAKRADEETVNGTVISTNFTQISQWHPVDFKDQKIRVNVRTCFEFTVHEIFGSTVQQYTDIVSPLRLTIILIITSFLLSVLDLSSRVILHTVSLIQCLAHSCAQVVLWGYILVNIEIYRRSWMTLWLKAGQTPTEVPMYPLEWLAFELHAFVIMMLSILDAVLFNYLPRRIRLLNSEGVYKCIQADTKREE